ncbi:MAG: enoyl-CoA hydratase/isomerase family protein [Burkholderiaceae bacterium]|nr:enoyl-CoA hydratase/isomerase family protein [Burkholderiaceae bacterium]
MKPECFSLEIDAGIATLTMTRGAEMNTITPAMWRELEQVLDDLQRDVPARVLVIASTGKHFSAGLALESFGGDLPIDDSNAAGRATLALTIADMQRVLDKLAALRMPVIAAIQGGCVGGGVDLVSACDMRFAVADAFFCIQEINIGLAADLGTLQRLPKLIPEGVVRELAYSGRRLGAARAHAIGLVNEVYADHAAMLAGVRALAAEIASKPPLAVWASKQAIDYAREHTVADGLRQMTWLQAGMWDTAAVVESVTARREGRTPRYRDLHKMRSFSGTGGGRS